MGVGVGGLSQLEPVDVYAGLLFLGVPVGGVCSGHHCWFCPRDGGTGCASSSIGEGTFTLPITRSVNLF